ncbi:MAG: tetratricopeptide repeat protein, partial [Gemmataceae bacterium]|nr:tetratricopeptide repeat protein [Gemmataceae bacterium]
YWGCHGWWQHLWEEHTAAMIFGMTVWGWNRLNYWFGLAPYYNPYYVAPVAVGDTYIDYSVSLAVPPSEAVGSAGTPPATAVGTQPPPPGVNEPGMKAFGEAQSAFHAGNYQDALKLVNQALARMPKDAIIHEFRALLLFALGNYDDAAAALHPVLAVAPGWNWTTMSSLYPDVATYTQQLRKLEAFVDQNPKSAQGHFVLAYHYLTCGHEDRALDELREVEKLAPKDSVAAQLRQLLAARNQSLDAAKDPPSTGAIDPAALVGTWTARRGPATFTLTIDADRSFTWTYTEGKNKQSVTGAIAVDGTTLSLEPDAGGVLLADVTVPKDGAFTFRTVGSPKEDPGLRFTRT